MTDELEVLSEDGYKEEYEELANRVVQAWLSIFDQSALPDLEGGKDDSEFKYMAVALDMLVEAALPATVWEAVSAPTGPCVFPLDGEPCGYLAHEPVHITGGGIAKHHDYQASRTERV